MFWDIAGWQPHRGTDIGRSAFLRIIERGLSSPKAGTQESAIHGIGEVAKVDGLPELEVLVRRFIAEGRTSRPELFAYAAQAAVGKII